MRGLNQQSTRRKIFFVGKGGGILGRRVFNSQSAHLSFNENICTQCENRKYWLFVIHTLQLIAKQLSANLKKHLELSVFS
jgi:hypothetical protein